MILKPDIFHNFYILLILNNIKYSYIMNIIHQTVEKII